MPGPIVRKYGFPNFEKIFGKRELEHGVEEEEEKREDAVDPEKREVKAARAEEKEKDRADQTS